MSSYQCFTVLLFSIALIFTTGCGALLNTTSAATSSSSPTSSSSTGSSSGSSSSSGSGSSSGSSSGSGGSSAPAGDPFTVQATRAYDFSDSVGVNTHFGYTNTAYYQQPGVLISAISQLNIRHIRDGLAYSWVAPNLYSIFASLANAGITADLIMPNPASPAIQPEAIESLLPNYPSADAIEGPNEYDASGDSAWAANLSAYLPTVWQVGQDSGLQVYGPSLTQTGSYAELGNVAAYMNDANLHAYWGGRNPETSGWGGPDAENNYYGSLPYDFDELAIDSPGRAVVMTETGYQASNTSSQNVIPESVEAVYEPRLLLHAWNMGIKRTYIYELMDDPSSPAGYGLLRDDLTQRPAYTAVSTLMNLLSDIQSDFSPQALTYWLSGNTQDIETTLLQKQDGSFWLAMWQPKSIFDVNAVAPQTVSPQSVLLTVPSGMQIENIWSFGEEGTVAESSPGSASATVSINTAVTLIEIAQQ